MPRRREFICFNARPVRSRGLGALVGALIGAGVGALTAQFVEVDRWERIEPRGVRVALVPAARGRDARSDDRFLIE